MEPLIKIENLTAGYEKKAIISDINLYFKSGQFVCLLGPNGAGKTTLLRVLSRHVRPMKGTVILKGRSLQEFSQAELARIMAVVITERVSPPLFKVHQFVALGRYPYTDFLGRLRPEDEYAVNRALHAVGAAKLVNREFSSLSDGERQKVLLARALCQEPEVLFLDEPTSHLDLKHRIEVMSILRQLCIDSNLLIVCAMHDVDLAAKVADQVVFIKDGTVKVWGALEEVLDPRSVSRLYDFENATFSTELGSIELRASNNRAGIFVVGGGGKGAPILRALSRMGFSLVTGILYENDVDYFVAHSLSATVISQELGRSIDEAKIQEAIHHLAGCYALVDARPRAIRAYDRNEAILVHARQVGMKIIEPPFNDLSSKLIKETFS